MNKKVLKIGAWSIAGAVLCGALVYYNFFDKTKVYFFEVGDQCPDFSARIIANDNGNFSLTDEQFTLSEKLGKVCIINFWDTWCTGCVQELHEFDAVYQAYSDQVEVIAVASNTNSDENLVKWLNDEGWSSITDKDWKPFTLTFAQGAKADDLFHNLGGSDGKGIPRTIIVDQSGVVTFEIDGQMTEEELIAQIAPLL